LTVVRDDDIVVRMTVHLISVPYDSGRRGERMGHVTIERRRIQGEPSPGSGRRTASM